MLAIRDVTHLPGRVVHLDEWPGVMVMIAVMRLAKGVAVKRGGGKRGEGGGGSQEGNGAGRISAGQ